MSITIDPADLVIRNSPAEWPAISEELINRLTVGYPQPIRDQFGNWHHFPQIPMLTPAQKEQIDAIAAARWFLIRIRNDAAIKACHRCGRHHRYFTVACIELPFNGVTDLTQALCTKEHGGDTIYDAVAIGDIEPIPESRARRYREQIIMRGFVPSPYVSRNARRGRV